MGVATSPTGSRAFTLVELLLVIVVISVLAAMLLPVNSGRRKVRVVICSRFLKDLGASFAAWSQTHNGRLPMQVSVTNGGTMELISGGSAAVHFQALTNSSWQSVNQVHYFSNGFNHAFIRSVTNFGVRLSGLQCPSESKRSTARSVAELADTNISYFVGVDVSSSDTNSILAGDRHLRNGDQPISPGLFALTPKSPIGWTKELHSSFGKGNILFVDGHVEFVKRPASLLKNDNAAVYRLAVP